MLRGKFAPLARGFAAVCGWLAIAVAASAQSPPTLITIFPAGATAGSTLELTVTGAIPPGPGTRLETNLPGAKSERLDAARFRLVVPADVAAGIYETWIASESGCSASRRFFVSPLPTILEVEPNDTATAATPLPLGAVAWGRADKAGDVDLYRVEAQAGQRIVFECQVESIDSKMRPTLEVLDETGRRLSVNRGFRGGDPLVAFEAPTTATYLVRVQDLVSSGGSEHLYRFSAETTPKVIAVHPSVVRRGEPARVTLFGWNLAPTTRANPPTKSVSAISSATAAFETTTFEIPANVAELSFPRRLPLLASQATIANELATFQVPGSSFPTAVVVTDVPVIVEDDSLRSEPQRQSIPIPGDVAGRLFAGDERDSYRFAARRGEVLYFEGFGQRLRSPVDLQLVVFDTDGVRELARFADDSRHVTPLVSTAHHDPTGRWVCPADGEYRLEVRNLAGGTNSDPTRVYRLSIRREDPDFELLAITANGGGTPLHVRRGGRESLELVVLRRRGFRDAIQVTASGLPAGVTFADTWIGPDVERTTAVISASSEAAEITTPHWNVIGRAAAGVVGDTTRDQASDRNGHHSPPRLAHSAMAVRGASPAVSGRLVAQRPLAVVGAAPIRMNASVGEPLQHHLYGKLHVRHSPGGIVDVLVRVERTNSEHKAAVKLQGVGLPPSIANQTTEIPAGESTGRLSFYLPPTLAVGRYSWVIRGETTAPNAGANGTGKVEATTIVSEPIVIDVVPPAFRVEIDPFAQRQVRRGETIQVAYSSLRLDGFIGKMHTELATPGIVTDVPGLRGRGETFVGQTDKGSLQIIVNDDAPLGPVPFLRLFTVGVVEDEPTYYGASFLPLEIVE